MVVVVVVRFLSGFADFAQIEQTVIVSIIEVAISEKTTAIATKEEKRTTNLTGTMKIW